MTKRVNIILNPASGKDLPVLSILNTAFGHDVDWDISVTHQSGDARRYTELAVADGVDIVATYGGDGTVSEVASVLAGGDVPLAILSGGTGNGVARFMSLPLELHRAAALLCGDYCIKHIDLGRMNDRTFILRGDIGFLARAGAETTRLAKDHLGKWAYVISAFRHHSLLRPTRYEMVIDGEELEMDAVMAMVVNMGAVAFGHKPFVHDVTPDDGLLDLLVLARTDVVALTEVAGSALFGNRSPMLHWKIKRAEICTASTQQTATDGELIAASKVAVEALPAAIRLIVPSGSSAETQGSDR